MAGDADIDLGSRPRIGRRLRFEILRRDGFTCRYCGGQAPDVVLTVDHVIPVVLGGSTEPTNLVAACKTCNAGKTSVQPDSSMVEDVAADALRWAKAMEKALTVYLMDREFMQYSTNAFNDSWLDWGFTVRVRTPTNQRKWKTERRYVPRDPGWRASIERFIGLGLPVEELQRLVRSVMERPGIDVNGRWKYFCGAAWRTLSNLQEDARRILETEAQP